MRAYAALLTTNRNNCYRHLGNCSRVFDFGGERPLPAKSKVSLRLSVRFHGVPVEVRFVSVEVSHPKFAPFSIDGLQ